MKQVMGEKVRRREDARFVTGRGKYTDDVKLPGVVWAKFVRSPHAHARVLGVDVSQAKAMPGVIKIYTGADLAGKMAPVPTAWIPPDSGLKMVPHFALATDRVRYVGDAVAMVIAESAAQAEDAMEAVVVEYEPLDGLFDQMEALKDGAVQLHDSAPGNVALHWKAGNEVQDAFEQADVVVHQRFRQQRLIPNPMEPRSAVASYDGSTGDLSIWVTSQNPHIHRFLLSTILGIPEHKLRVVAQDVGGGFGSKIACYPDEVLVSYAARDLGVPVKWTETRSEHFLVTSHGRDHVDDVELAGTRDGRVLGVRVKAYANMGAYLSTAGPGVPTILFGLIVNGAYDIPKASCEVVGVFTNTTPVDAYRGAGRPEATYLIERIMDRYAKEIGMDPLEVRRRNLITRDRFPYTNPFGITYDSGDYHRALDRALEILDYPKIRSEQQELRKQGKYIGIGLSTYVEMCGLGPSQVAGAVGFQGGLWENAMVRLHPTGKATVFTGASPHGQGEETTFAQIAADRLGIPIEDIEVVHGDTDRVSMGWGTYGSRSTAVGGSALAVACQRIVDKAKIIGAHMLEVPVEAVQFDGGRIHPEGSPERSVSIQDVTLQAHLAWNLPAGVEPGMEASAFYDPTNFTYPFGTHIAVVSVDPDLGEVKLLRYIAVDDCGPLINPLIVQGQIQGGIVQGIGQALYEGAVYDEDSQLITGSFLDYAMPKAHSFPDFELDHTVTPSPHNPLGVKGVGETGTIASTPAVVNAVMDALAPFGITDLPMPLTGPKVWAAMKGGAL